MGTSLIHLLKIIELKEGAVLTFRAVSARAPFRARFRPDRVGRFRARRMQNSYIARVKIGISRFVREFLGIGMVSIGSSTRDYLG